MPSTNNGQLVGFIASPNPKIRQIALDNLLPYSLELPAIFKTDGLLPVKNLRTAATDHPVGSLKDLRGTLER